jgi:hypothetical protein
MLQCIDESKQEYRRIGIGWYEMGEVSTIFKDVHDRVITLV